MDDLDFNLYVVAEMRYKDENNDKQDIFPVDWYSSNNYKLKTEIIAEAIKNHITIEETELYQNFFGEGKSKELLK